MNIPNLSGEEEVKVFNFLQTMEKAFDEKSIEKVANKWYHDFCLKKKVIRACRPELWRVVTQNQHG